MQIHEASTEEVHDWGLKVRKVLQLGMVVRGDVLMTKKLAAQADGMRMKRMKEGLLMMAKGLAR